MLLNLKAFSSLLLALGLFACNGDDDDKATGDYKLVVSKPSSAAVGTAMSIDVALHKGDAIVKDDDAKAAKDGKVNGSVKCKEGDKVEASEVKFNDAGKATLEITIADNSDKTAAAAGTKGYTDCVVSASAEFGKDKTKASGSSEQFAVAAKTDGDSGDDGAGNELAVSVKADGHIVVENPPTSGSPMIKLTQKQGETCSASLVQWTTTESGTGSNKTYTHAVTSQPQGQTGFPANLKDIYLSGNPANCEVSVDGKAKATLPGDYEEADEIATATTGDGTLDFDYDSAVTSLEIDWLVNIAGNNTATGFPKSGRRMSANDTANVTVSGLTNVTGADGWIVWAKHSGGIQKLL